METIWYTKSRETEENKDFMDEVNNSLEWWIDKS